MHRLGPGARFGPYRVVRHLETAVTSEHYEATRQDSERPLLLKVVRPHSAKLFAAEVTVARALQHPNVIETVDTGVVEGHAYLVQEQVQGTSYAALLERLRTAGQLMPVAAAMWIAHQMLLGLEHMHGARDADGNPLQLVHRNVTPRSVLLSSRGEVKLTGLASALGVGLDERTVAGMLHADLAYAAPEQLRSGTVDARADLFLTGLVLYIALRGLPVDNPGGSERVVDQVVAKTLPALAEHGASQELSDTVMQALAADPAERFSSARQLADALAGLLAPRCGGDLNRMAQQVADLVAGKGAVSAAPMPAVVAARMTPDPAPPSKAPLPPPKAPLPPPPAPPAPMLALPRPAPVAARMTPEPAPPPKAPALPVPSRRLVPPGIERQAETAPTIPDVTPAAPLVASITTVDAAPEQVPTVERTSGSPWLEQATMVDAPVEERTLPTPAAAIAPVATALVGTAPVATAPVATAPGKKSTAPLASVSGSTRFPLARVTTAPGTGPPSDPPHPARSRPAPSEPVPGPLSGASPESGARRAEQDRPLTEAVSVEEIGEMGDAVQSVPGRSSGTIDPDLAATTKLVDTTPHTTPDAKLSATVPHKATPDPDLVVTTPHPATPTPHPATPAKATPATPGEDTDLHHAQTAMVGHAATPYPDTALLQPSPPEAGTRVAPIEELGSGVAEAAVVQPRSSVTQRVGRRPASLTMVLVVVAVLVGGTAGVLARHAAGGDRERRVFVGQPVVHGAWTLTVERAQLHRTAAGASLVVTLRVRRAGDSGGSALGALALLDGGGQLRPPRVLVVGQAALQRRWTCYFPVSQEQRPLRLRFTLPREEPLLLTVNSITGR